MRDSDTRAWEQPAHTRGGRWRTEYYTIELGVCLIEKGRKKKSENA